MSASTPTSPRTAWDPIDENQWTEDNVRHLMRRASWTARPAEVGKLAELSPGDAVDRLFQRAEYPDKSAIVEAYAAHVNEELGDEIDDAIAWAKGENRYKAQVGRIKQKTYRDPATMAVVVAHYNHLRNEARRTGRPNEFRAQFRDRFGQREYWTKYALDWLKMALRPQNSAFEKAVTFMQNVWVVNWASLRISSVNGLADIHNHHQMIRRNLFANYPDFCKKAYKTRGMGHMLDIIGSTKNRPNENFARELMELFTLGVDNGYDEDDIKEIARAFTGYKPSPALSPYDVEPGQTELVLDESEHDATRKKVYGRSRDYDGDAIVDLIFSKPEVEVFLPSELCKFYLTDDAVPEEYVAELGKLWRANDFNLYWLLKTFFTSKMFYSESVKGRVFKSPHQFYLGLLQDLGLQAEPSLEIVQELDYLGQPFADPPDVNGWNGGAFWINNGSLNARRIMANRVFAEDYRRGMSETTAGAGSYVVSDEQLKGFLDSSGKEGREVVDHFITYLLPVQPQEAYVEALQSHFAKGDDQVTALKQVIMAILQSQYYQVC